MFPGLGIATVAFAGYCVYEAMFLAPEQHHHPQHESGKESGVGNAAGTVL